MRWGRGQCGRVLNCEEITVYKFDHSTVDERPAVRFTLLKTLVGPSRRFSNFSAEPRDF
jgi:hypothetical protein